MTNIISNGAYVNYNRYYDMVHTLSRRTSTKELESFGEFSEGIEHLWSKAAQQPTWDLVMKQIKSKRYTYARLQRNDFEIPLIQKWAKAPNELNTLGQTMHQIDTLATDIQALCLHNEVKRMGHMDYTYTPQYIK